jgi:hypothetical protein
MRKVRLKVEIAAAGGYLKGRHSSTRVVKWDPDGRNVRPGPGIFHLYLLSIYCVYYIYILYTHYILYVIYCLQTRCALL